MVKGKFILSINDVPQIREIFGAFRLEEVRTTYSIGTGKGSSVGELLVSNFEPVVG